MSIRFEKLKKLFEQGKFKLKSGKGIIQRDLTSEEILRDLQENHNHSWYEELYLRNKDTLDDIALFYRGTEVTYREMFENMRIYAKALKELGVEKGDEIPICISNTPELVYILGAISILGCKANIFSDHMDEEYTSKIISECNSEIAFIEDSKYEGLSKILSKSHIKHIVMPSIASSLKDGNPYEEMDKEFGGLENTTDSYTRINDSIMDIDFFVNLGKHSNKSIESDVSLDDEFTITYSSGTTSNRPKPIVHTVRSFITIGRCHDPEIQKSASMKKMTVEALIPTYSNTDIISSISDALMQGSKLALEPFYSKESFLNSLIINKPTYVVATRSFWIYSAKKILYDSEYQGTKLPFLLIPFAVGEPLEVNEEKLLNKALRKASAGKDIIKTPISPVVMSVAGGDCEHGGIFWMLFRSIQSKRPGYLFKHEPIGLKTFPMVETAILDENGNVLPPDTYGRLVANSPCNMKGYKNRPKETAEFFIKDATGKVWGDCSVYAKKDKNGYVTIKGRIPKSDEDIPEFVISDAILRDTKNILSCEVVEDQSGLKVAHIEFQPSVKKKGLKSILSAEQRCMKLLGKSVTDNLVYRIHGFDESYVLNGSGKRNINVLADEGLERCVKPEITPSGYSLISAEQYLERRNQKGYSKKKTL